MDSQKHCCDRFTVSGEARSCASYWPIRAILVASGIVFLIAVIRCVGRYCLGYRKLGTISLQDNTLVANLSVNLLGMTVRRVSLRIPSSQIRAAVVESRYRYFALLAGFGAGVVGIWFGLQWILDGLRAGYPYLCLFGGLIVLLGVIGDAILYQFASTGPGRSYLLILTEGINLRLSGLSEDSARRMAESVQALCGCQTAK